MPAAHWRSLSWRACLCWGFSLWGFFKVLKVLQMLLLMVVKQRNMARDQYWIISPRKMQSPSTFSVASNWLTRMKKKEMKVLMKNGTLSFVKWYLHSSSIGVE